MRWQMMVKEKALCQDTQPTLESSAEGVPARLGALAPHRFYSKDNVRTLRVLETTPLWQVVRIILA